MVKVDEVFDRIVGQGILGKLPVCPIYNNFMGTKAS